MRVAKFYDIRTGSELDCAELNYKVPAIVEVKQAGRLALALSCP